jgi:hypothetical protein
MRSLVQYSWSLSMAEWKTQRMPTLQVFLESPAGSADSGPLSPSGDTDSNTDEEKVLKNFVFKDHFPVEDSMSLKFQASADSKIPVY